jgi:hypothetical protein
MRFKPHASKDPNSRRRPASARSPIRRVRSSVLPRGPVAALVAMLVVVAGGTVGAGAASAAPVTVTLAGSAKGSVTSNPAGIDCSNVPGAEATDCSFDFPFALGGITLSAVAADGAVLKEWTGTVGGTCSGATNPCQTAAILVTPLTATATFSLKPDKPLVTTGAASDIAFPSATLSGTVNPNSADFGLSDCYFEYGTTTDYGAKTPCRPATVGPGTDAVPVTASAGSLEPDAVYHYRVVAANGGGVSAGEDQTFTAAAAPADGCPNAAIRAQQHVLARTLPNCMAYELVAPPFTLGQKVFPGPITPDGNGLIFTSPGAIEGAGNAPDLGGAFHARRTDEGWRTVPMIPSATEFPTWSAASSQGTDYSVDGHKVLWWVQRREDMNTMRFTPVLSDSDGNVEIVGPTVDDGAGAGGLTSSVIAASADMRTLAIESSRRNMPSDGSVDTRTTSRHSLYVSRPSPDAPGEYRVQQVAFRAGATMLPNCSVRLGSDRSARGAVSDDGRRIFFSFTALGSCTTAANQRVWVSDGNAEVEDLSASRCTTNCGATAQAYFEVASYDGQRVYFTTEQKLVDGDQDDSARADLYVHDMSLPSQDRLRPVTASGSPGEGAGVLGVVRASDNGAYVYFAANGRPLSGANARGEVPQAGNNNLYLYHRPRWPLGAPATIRFVGQLDAADVNRSTQYSLLNAQDRPVVTSPDGRFLLFAAYSNLTGEKQPGDSERDLFRYDAATDELLRIWSDDPNHNGANRQDGIWPADLGIQENPFNGARQKQRRPKWVISDDGGTVGFATTERLSADDVNDKRDAYMWRADTGSITLLSGGRSIIHQGVGGVSRGGDVFFTSDASLVSEHRSGQTTLFVARRGGGFAPPPEPPEPCHGDGCQGQPTPPPSAPPVGSVSHEGDGNVRVPGPLKASINVSKLRAVSGLAGRLKVRVPNAGRISVAGRLVRRTRRSASKAGTYSVRVALRPGARRKLKQNKRLRVVVRISYRMRGGSSASKRVRVTFKQPKSKRAKGKKGGR